MSTKDIKNKEDLIRVLKAAQYHAKAATTIKKLSRAIFEITQTAIPLDQVMRLIPVAIKRRIDSEAYHNGQI